MRREPATVATGEPIEMAKAAAGGGKVGATGEPEAAAEAAEWTTPSTGRAPGNSRVTVQKLFWRSMGTGISSSAWPAGMTARKSQTGGQSSPWEMITGSKGPAMSVAWLPDCPDERTDDETGDCPDDEPDDENGDSPNEQTDDETGDCPADETEDEPADETGDGQEGWRERHTARTSTSETGTLR